jgi:hypothetical protein
LFWRLEDFHQLAPGHAALGKEKSRMARGLQRAFVMNDRNQQT